MTAAVPHDDGCALLSAAGGEPTACSCTVSLGLGTDRPAAPEPPLKPNPQPDLDTTQLGRYHDMELALEGARALLRLAGETPAPLDGTSRGQ